MNRSSSLVTTLVTVMAIAGCSSPGTTTSSGTTASSSTTTSSATTTAGSATSSSNPPVTVTVTSSPPQAQGSAGGIDVTISAQGPTTLRPGGAPMRFNVTLINTTSGGMARVGLVVSLGHCSCTTGAQMMPAGSLRLLDPDTKAWQTVPYVREGTGGDFLHTTLVEPFVLEQGQNITYQLEIQLDAQQDLTVAKGDSAINVTMTNTTTNTAVGVSPTASLPISVEP